jgi:lipopolysaccharide/colanic/teichoic acid biosynthesis glycosyltransferase
MELLLIAARSFYETLLSAGIEVYERQGVVLHAKTEGNKLRMELQYVERHSLRLDIVILFRTIQAVLQSKVSGA